MKTCKKWFVLSGNTDRNMFVEAQADTSEGAQENKLRRIIDVLHSYVLQDVEASETAYVREILTDVCGCTREECAEYGLDWLWPEGENDD